MVSYKEVKGRIQKLWPKCKNVWLDDMEYEYPSLVDVETVVAFDHTERLTYRGYRFDCDDFALQLCAAFSKYAGKNWDGGPRPFGSVRGRKFKHLSEPHKCCVCVLEDKILIIEPQTDEIFDAHPTEDDIFFVGMPG